MPSRRGGDARAELGGFGAQLLVRELLHLRLKGVDGGDDGQHALDGALVRGAKDFSESLIEKHVESPIFQCKWL